MSKPLIPALAALIAVTLAAAPAWASDVAAREAKQVIALKDGTTLYVFKDGKMAREDKLGRVAQMKVGDVFQAADGREVKVTSNETGRLGLLLREGHYN